MMAKIRGKVASILVLVLFGITIFSNNVGAADILPETTVNDDSGTMDLEEAATEEPEGEPSQEEIQQTEPAQEEIQQTEPVQEKAQQTEPESEEQQKTEAPADKDIAAPGLINYLAVESPYLESPGEQKLVVSYGDGSENISDARLVCERADKSKLEIKLDKKENELYLFTYTFDKSGKGVYQLLQFVYVQNGVETAINLSDIGVGAMFGVDEYYPGYETDSNMEISAEDAKTVEASVVNIETDKIEDAEADIEETIEETAEDVEETGGDSKDSDNAEKTLGGLMSSLADFVMPEVTAQAKSSDGKYVVVLDPGHGGHDSGASANGLLEKNINLKIAQACKAELEEYNGVEVHLTREGDYYVGLSDRVYMAAKWWNADVFVSLHINSAGKAANGAEVWYPNSSYRPNVYYAGQDLSNKILVQLAGIGLNTSRGLKTLNSTNGGTYPDGSIADYYTVICESKEYGFPGIIVEHAFITNPSDAAKLAQDSFLKQLGVADATGIANYFGLTRGPSIKLENKNDFAGTAQIVVAGLGNGATVDVYNEDTKQSKRNLFSNGRGTLQFKASDYGGGGQYHVEARNSSGQLLGERLSFYVSKDTSSTITLDSDGTERQFKVNVQFADMPPEVQEVIVPTWCSPDQKDIIWYNAKQVSKGNWQAVIDISKHKLAGTYTSHVYVKLTSGELLCLGATTFKVSLPTVTVRTDNYKKNAGTFDVLVENVNYPPGILKIDLAVWCAPNQSDFKWYTAAKQGDGTYKATVSIANHNYMEGNYNVHAYITTGNGLLVCGGGTSMKVTLPEMQISATDTNGAETSYELKIANAGLLGAVRSVQFGVWSNEGGQDDFIWYNGSRNSLGEWKALANIRNHKHAGTYNVHVYATFANGTLRFLGATTFKVSPPTVTVRTDNYKKNAGTFDVLVENVNCPSGISKIDLAVWCAPNQSDFKWYTAAKQGDGTYKATVSIANHNYMEGNYNVHAYITTGDGLLACGGGTSMKVTLPEMQISATDTNGAETSYELKIANAGLLGAVRSVQFGVWSNEGGQDDFIWYNGSRNSLGEWKALANIRNHKHAGAYNVHVYATFANGTLRFLGATTFKVSPPTVTVRTDNYKKNAGIFDVLVENVNCPSGISKIDLAVWCAPNQSDFKWYTAAKQGDGTYKATVSIANHNYMEGNYNVHAYITTGNGLLVCGGGTSMKVTLPEMQISVTDTNGAETSYELKIANAGLLGAVRSVQFGVWSNEGGQDDFIWYNGSRNSLGEWKALANIRNHKHAGTYNVHVYATFVNGTLRCLGATKFTVTKASATSIVAKNYDVSTGMFQVEVSGISAKSGVSEVRVPVWCASDQSDIRWYNAAKQSEGTYLVNVDPMYHNYNSGLYKIHIYVTEKNGLMTCVGGSSQMVNATRYYSIMGNTTTTVEQMMRYYESSGHSFPSDALGKTLREFCQLYYDEATAEGVRAEVAFAQAMKETGWLRYGGIVQIWQFNFAGLGALDGNAAGNCASFATVQEGIRAQIQHLKAYACTSPALKYPVVDPRFALVTKGCAPYVEWLGQKENPQHLGWATGVNYGPDIVAMIKVLKTK